MPLAEGHMARDLKLLAVRLAFNATPALGATEMNLCKMRISQLRGAIRNNQVSFPSQVPMFPKHDRPDLQRKLAQLYFVLGWSAGRIGARYVLGRSRAQQILNTWRRRAVFKPFLLWIPACPGSMLRSGLFYPRCLTKRGVSQRRETNVSRRKL